MPRIRSHALTALAFAAIVATAGPPAGEGVAWRHDYAAARKEAAETGRPLLLDFGTEACTWCRKLDATTFRDPKVVKLLGERFIPVKIDGHQERALAAGLGVEAYPTLVVATADGKVVARHAGYLDAQQMTELLNKAPKADRAPPRQSAVAVTEFDEKNHLLTRLQADATLDAVYLKIATALNR